jgi:hypothetical protein
MTAPHALLAAIDMGYGHLRAAHALGSALELPVRSADEPALAGPAERKLWARVRRFYEFVSRTSQVPVLGRPFDFALGAITSIPGLYPLRDQSAPTMAVRYLERNARNGLGRGMIEHLQATGQALLTTFYAPAVVADLAGCERIFCVVTDTDVNRIWAPPDGPRTRIRFLCPGQRAVRRLRSYGVPASHITYTGFPLPPELMGGRELPVLKRNLAARLARLDPHGAFRDAYGDEVDHFLGVTERPASSLPPLITFAVGGAGAQAGLARRFLPGFRRPVAEGKLRLALVAGVRAEVAVLFSKAIEEAGLSNYLEPEGRGIQVLLAPDMTSYFQRFNALLAETDVLWTKPSELTFFAALGLPLLFAPPVGTHESYNLRWAREAGAGLKQRDPTTVAERLVDLVDDGTLAGAAWSGYMRLPKFGTYKIADLVRGLTSDAGQPAR